jgi:hypothetical protein
MNAFGTFFVIITFLLFLVHFLTTAALSAAGFVSYFQLFYWYFLYIKLFAIKKHSNLYEVHTLLLVAEMEANEAVDEFVKLFYANYWNDGQKMDGQYKIKSLII